MSNFFPHNNTGISHIIDLIMNVFIPIYVNGHDRFFEDRFILQKIILEKMYFWKHFYNCMHFLETIFAN